jgi:hypothetical protein
MGEVIFLAIVSYAIIQVAIYALVKETVDFVFEKLNRKK